jgi:TP901 family phage tail tape measure protein
VAEREVAVRLTAMVDTYVAAMRRASGATGKFATDAERDTAKANAGFKKLGGDMQAVGGKMTRFVTLPLVALGGAAIAASVSWESAWAGVTKTVDGTVGQMANLEAGLRDMAKELPATHGQIAAVAEAAGQLGVGIDDIEGFTRVMIDLGETTNLSADEAATSIAQLMNVMQTAPEDVDNLGAALVALGNNGASTERDIVMMAQRIAGAASIVGMSESDVLGLANALASVGIEVEAGGSAISRVMTDIAKAVSTGNTDLARFAEVAGMSAQDFATAFSTDPSSAIVSFVEGLGAINSAGGDVFTILEELGQSDVRVSNALLTMASSSGLLRESLDLGAKAWQENSALEEEASKRYETTAAKMAILRNQIVDVAIDLGEMLLPVLIGVAGAVGDLVRWFGDLPQPLKYVAIGFLAVLAAMGPLLTVAGKLISNFTAIQSALAGLRAVMVAHPLIAFATAMVAVGVAVVALNGNVAKGEAAIRGLRDAMKEAGNEADGMISWLQTVVADSDDLTSAMAAAGITTAELAAAAAEGGDSFDRLKDRLVESAEAAGMGGLELETFGAQLSLLPAIADAATKNFKDLTATERSTTEASKEMAYAHVLAGQESKKLAEDAILLADEEKLAAAAAEEQAAAEKIVAEQLRRSEEATDDLMRSLDPLVTIFDELAHQADLVDSALRRVMGGQLSLEESTRAIYDNVEALSTAFEENGITLDINTEAGRKNRAQVQASVEGILSYASAMVGAGSSVDEVTGMVDWQRQSLIDQMVQFGLTKDEAAAYVDQLGLTPENIVTSVALANDELMREKLQGLIDDLEVIDEGAAAEIQALVDQGEYDEAERQLTKLTRDRNVSIAIQAFIASGGYVDIIEESVKKSADGRYVDRPMLSTLGETGPEAVLPLDRPGRLATLLADPRIGAPVAAAMSSKYTPVSFSPASSGSQDSTSAGDRNVNFYGGIHNTVDFDAALRAGQFALASVA